MKYKDSMSKIELSYLKNEYLKTYQIYFKMKFYKNLDFKNFENNLIILKALEIME